MATQIQLATMNDLKLLLPLVKAYHQFEEIDMTDAYRSSAISKLLSNSLWGNIWLVQIQEQCVGYLALTFGYSIEFGGKDAFIDEFYIQPAFRNQGIGQQTLALIQEAAKSQGIYAIHLEVAHDNTRAKQAYMRANFQPRDKYVLMSKQLRNV